MRKIIAYVILPMLLCACSPSVVRATSPALDFTYFLPSVDESVSCPGLHPVVDDISTKYGDILRVEANTRKIPGLYMNAIASRQFDFSDNSTYIVSGDWRNPEGAQNEQIDINLQFTDNYVESHAEIFWTLNPQSPLYEWVWTRYQDFEPVKLFQVKEDHEWHTFKLVAAYTANPNKNIIKSIQVDGNASEQNREMGTNPKKWERSFFLLLETVSRYTNCSKEHTFTGASEWRDVRIETNS